MARIPKPTLPVALGLISLLSACSNVPARPDPAPAASATASSVYPVAVRGDQVDEYHGVKVSDPYRWLEDIDSAATRAWVEAEHRHTADFLAAIPQRAALRTRLEQLWDYERYTPYERHGKHYAYTRNDGLQNQASLYVTTEPGKPGRLLLDPNTLSAEGTVAFKGGEFSPDGKYFAYGLSSAGSDWEQWKVLEVATGKPRNDMLDWVKFSQTAWRKDGSGFYYSRYDEPKGQNALKAVNQFQKLYFHPMNRPQFNDELVYERPDQADWTYAATTTDDGKYLAIAVSRSTEPKNLVLIKDLTAPGATVRELISDWTASYELLGNEGTVFYFLTDDGAPRYRVVAIDVAHPQRERWREVVAQDASTLTSARLVGGRLVLHYLKDAHSDVRRYSLQGKSLGTVDLPGLGTASDFTGGQDDDASYFRYTSFIQAPAIYRLDVTSGTVNRIVAPAYPADISGYETRQQFYTSKDGTRVPMFITARKGLVLDGNNPTILYGYGGFNIPLTPTFSPAVIGWLDQGGVYVQANLRGGGEYGRDWHEAGMKLRKQNVFDDFIAAAETLIADKITSPRKLAIRGGSNGGLLAAAVALQRPDLFAAAVPAVGVLDMLRFREFTIGKAWESDYGSVTNADEFAALHAYSPLHAIRPGVNYPAILITTGDHDDRVFPAHSFKFAAALQAVNPPRPALIRIDVRAGHGAGKPTSKQIDEAADVYAFILKAFGD